MYKRLTEKVEVLDSNVLNCSVCPKKQQCKGAENRRDICLEVAIDRLAELEDRIENGTLVELGKPYIRQLNSIPQQDKYIICKAQEVGITGVLAKAEAEQRLKELRGEV